MLAGDFALTLYGNHRHGQRVTDVSVKNDKAGQKCEDAANKRNQAETARVSELVAVLDSHNRNRSFAITGLLNAINCARPKGSSRGVDDREAEWPGLFGSCAARAESLSSRLGDVGFKLQNLLAKLTD